jgi:hypothetical protein
MFGVKKNVLAFAALSTLTLGTLASVGMAGPPKQERRGNDFDFRIVIGDRLGLPGWGHGADSRDRRDHGHRDECIEVIPQCLELTAFQAGDTVLLFAKGENRSGGFTTRLEREGRGDRLKLINTSPRGRFVTQRLTPFQLSGSFQVRGCLTEITVCVAGQNRCVKVCQVQSIPPC